MSMLSLEQKDAPVAAFAYWLATQDEADNVVFTALVMAFQRLVNQYRLEVHTIADQQRFLARLTEIRMAPELKHDVDEGEPYRVYRGQAKAYYAFEQSLARQGTPNHP